MGRTVPAAIGLLLAFSATGVSQAPSLQQVTARLAAYLRTYAQEYSATIADEHYEQTAGGESAALDSEFAIVRLAGEAQWLGFRDVLRVDGKPVADREDRLADLFSTASSGDSGFNASTAARGTRIVKESARFNVGPVQRTINNPALILELLDPRHHRGFAFSKAGDDRVGDLAVWKVAFKERGSRTVVRTTDGRSVPAVGTLWVDPATGRLLRADVTIAIRGIRTRVGTLFHGMVSLTFKEFPERGLWLPDRLIERYWIDTAMAATTVQGGEATYTNYRRFGVEGRMIPPPVER